MKESFFAEFSKYLLRSVVIVGSGVAFWYVYSGLIQGDYEPFEQSVLNILRLIGTGVTAIFALLVTTFFEFKSQRQQTEELFLKHSPTFEKLVNALSSPIHGPVLMEMIESLDKHTADAEPVFSSILSARLTRISDDIKGITSGRFEVSEAQEIAVTKLLIKEGQWRHNIKAVNYDEEDWWLSGQGYRYLEDHAGLASTGVDIQRIFIIQGEDKTYIKDVIEAHKKINAKAFVLLESEVTDASGGHDSDLLQDFVIYDDKLVRFANPKSAEHIGKYAVVTSNAGVIDPFLDSFRRLQTIVEGLERDVYELPTAMQVLDEELPSSVSEVTQDAS